VVPEVREVQEVKAVLEARVEPVDKAELEITTTTIKKISLTDAIIQLN